jgi:hypothetical protein
VGRFGQRPEQIWYGWSCDDGQLDIFEPDAMPANLQVQANVREDLSGVQNIPARRHFDPRSSSHERVSPYICAQFLIPISPHRRLVLVKTRRGTFIRRRIGTAVRQVFEDSRKCHYLSLLLHFKLYVQNSRGST